MPPRCHFNLPMCASTPTPVQLTKSVAVAWHRGGAMAQSHLTLARWAWLSVLVVSLSTTPWAVAQTKINLPKASASAQQRTAKAGKSQHRTQAAKAPAHGDTPEVQALAERLAQAHQLPLPWVRRQIAHAARLDSLSSLVLPPATPSAKNWQAYRERFVEPRRIAAGLAFWQQHRLALQRAEKNMACLPSWWWASLGWKPILGGTWATFG